MNLSEAAAQSGISIEGLRLAIQRGRLAATLADGHWEISPADLDAYLANRQMAVRGAANGNAVLDEGDIPAIRARLRAGDSLRAIASDYEVTKSTINRIKHGETWKHVP